jgi:antitoxin ParD1/3/4
MSISLTPSQEHFIQNKLQSGKYRSAEEVMEIALRLLDEYDRADALWIEDIRKKSMRRLWLWSERRRLMGKMFINQFLEGFRQL